MNINQFEEIIDSLILVEVSNEDIRIKEKINSLPLKQKRLAILSILDKDRGLYIKLKNIIENSNVSKVEHIKDVVKMIREYVKVGDVEKKKFGEVMTPIELVEEMLDTLPIEVWINPNLKWLDPANGVGVFPSVVVNRLMKGLEDFESNEELRYKHIVENMIYVCELQPKNMFLHLCSFDPQDIYLLNIFTGSFLSEEFDKHCKEEWNVDKFDVIVGNPPYQDSETNKVASRGAKRNLYQKFIVKSLDVYNKYLIFVNPNGFLKQSNPNKLSEVLISILNNNLKFIKLGIQKYFKTVNTGELCYYIIEKSNNEKLTAIINHENETIEFDFNKYKFIPTIIHKETFSIIDKIMNLEDGINLNIQREVKQISDSNFVELKMMNNRLTTLKVEYGDINNYNYMSNLIMKHSNPLLLKNILNSNIFSYINKIFNYDGCIYHHFLNQFKIPVNLCVYKDKEIYQIYNLNELEIKLILTTLKK